MSRFTHHRQREKFSKPESRNIISFFLILSWARLQCWNTTTVNSSWFVLNFLPVDICLKIWWCWKLVFSRLRGTKPSLGGLPLEITNFTQHLRESCSYHRHHWANTTILNLMVLAPVGPGQHAMVWRYFERSVNEWWRFLTPLTKTLEICCIFSSGTIIIQDLQ